MGNLSHLSILNWQTQYHFNKLIFLRFKIHKVISEQLFFLTCLFLRSKILPYSPLHGALKNQMRVYEHIHVNRVIFIIPNYLDISVTTFFSLHFMLIISYFLKTLLQIRVGITHLKNVVLLGNSFRGSLASLKLVGTAISITVWCLNNGQGLKYSFEVLPSSCLDGVPPNTQANTLVIGCYPYASRVQDPISFLKKTYFFKQTPRAWVFEWE